MNVHFVVKDLGFAGLGFGDQGLVKNVKDILADLLQFALDLLTIFADCWNMFVRALGFLLLLDGRDYAPGGTSSSDDVLVGHGKEIALVDREFTAKLVPVSPYPVCRVGWEGGVRLRPPTNINKHELARQSERPQRGT